MFASVPSLFPFFLLNHCFYVVDSCFFGVPDFPSLLSLFSVVSILHVAHVYVLAQQAKLVLAFSYTLRFFLLFLSFFSLLSLSSFSSLSLLSLFSFSFRFCIFLSLSLLFFFFFFSLKNLLGATSSQLPCDKPRKRREQGRVFGKSRYAFVCICVFLFPLLGEGFERKPKV